MAVILSPRGNEASNMMKRFVRYEEAAQYFGIDEEFGTGKRDTFLSKRNDGDYDKGFFGAATQEKHRGR